MPEQLGMAARYSSAEYEKIKGGYSAQSMDEKWDLKFEGSCLFMRRSWTGHTIYQVEFIPDGRDWMISNSWVNRDPNQYKWTYTDFDREFALYLIDTWLLGKNVPFPTLPPKLQVIQNNLEQAKAQIMKRRGLWVFDKAVGLIVFAVGIALLLFGAAIVILLWDHNRAMAYKGILFFSVFGVGCLYVGVTLFRRAGQGGPD